jgi:hypothetical protein
MTWAFTGEVYDVGCCREVFAGRLRIERGLEKRELKSPPVHTLRRFRRHDGDKGIRTAKPCPAYPFSPCLTVKSKTFSPSLGEPTLGVSEPVRVPCMRLLGRRTRATRAFASGFTSEACRRASPCRLSLTVNEYRCVARLTEYW